LPGVKQAFGSREQRKRVGKIDGKRERVSKWQKWSQNRKKTVKNVGGE
jgi:hypothetical protein